VAGRPRLESESVDSPQFSSIGDLLADTEDDHASPDPTRGIDAIDLKRRPRRAQEGVQATLPKAAASRRRHCGRGSLIISIA
jgi:hypothetical protein